MSGRGSIAVEPCLLEVEAALADHPAIKQIAVIAAPDADGRALILKASEKLGLTARGYHRILRSARTIADLDGSDHVLTRHLAEAISYRLPFVAGG